MISQRKYILDLVENTRKLGAKLVETPIEQNHGLHCKKGELHEPREYQRLIVKLIYLSFGQTYHIMLSGVN